MNHSELVISFGDTQPVTLSTVTQDGLVINETPDKIVIKFVGPDPSFYSKKLERFLRRGVLVTAKRNNEPRRNVRGALLLLDESEAIIKIGKYPIGVDIDAEPEEQRPVASVAQQESSLVAQLLARLDQQQSRIDELESNQKDLGQKHLDKEPEVLKTGKLIATEANTPKAEPKVQPEASQEAFGHAEAETPRPKKEPKDTKKSS